MLNESQKAIIARQVNILLDNITKDNDPELSLKLLISIKDHKIDENAIQSIILDRVLRKVESSSSSSTTSVSDKSDIRASVEQLLKICHQSSEVASLSAILKEDSSITVKEIDEYVDEMMKIKCSSLASDLGLIEAKKGNFKKAIKIYDLAIEHSSDAITYNRRATAKRELKDFNGAMADYDKAIQIKPAFANAYYNRGILKLELRGYGRASHDFMRCIRHNPNYAPAFNKLGLTYIELNKLLSAANSFNKAIELEPKFAEAYKNLGDVLKLRGDRCIDEAERYRNYEDACLKYKKAKKLKPSYNDELKEKLAVLKELTYEMRPRIAKIEQEKNIMRFKQNIENGNQNNGSSSTNSTQNDENSVGIEIADVFSELAKSFIDKIPPNKRSEFASFFEESYRNNMRPENQPTNPYDMEESFSTIMSNSFNFYRRPENIRRMNDIMKDTSQPSHNRPK